MSYANSGDRFFKEQEMKTQTNLAKIKFDDLEFSTNYIKEIYEEGKITDPKSLEEEIIKRDLKDHSREYIILRELRNFSCFHHLFNGICNCINKLDDYGIYPDEIEAVYEKYKNEFI